MTTCPLRAGRPKQFDFRMVIHLLKDTRERIDAVRNPAENRSDFVRAAIETEIARRQKEATGDPSEVEELRARNALLSQQIAQLTIERDYPNKAEVFPKRPT